VAAVSTLPCIEPTARKEEYFGLETESTSTRRSQLKFQVSAASGCAGSFRKKRQHPVVARAFLPVMAVPRFSQTRDVRRSDVQTIL